MQRVFSLAGAATSRKTVAGSLRGTPKGRIFAVSAFGLALYRKQSAE
jgi:ABC-type arginine/histidine transport system permease subunit